MGKAGVVAGAIGVAALTLVGGSYMIGGNIETGFRNSMMEMSGPAVQVRVLD